MAATTAAAGDVQVKSDLPPGTWFKGDLHVHDDHSSDGSAPRQLNHDKAKGNTGIADQIGQATLMGLQFMPFTDHRTYDQHYDPAWQSSSLLLMRGEEANGSPHANVLGGEDTVVQGVARADRPGFAHVQQSVWNAHSQGAVWQVNHPDDGETNSDGSPNVYGNVQGIDLVETWNHSADAQTAYAENRWNAGFRFGVAGASDSHMRELWDGEGTQYGISNPGMPTSNVLATTFNERGLIQGLRRGHTSLSYDPKGPFVTLSTDLGSGRYTSMGGDEVFVQPGTRGHLRIEVSRAAGLYVVVYRMPGKSAGPIATFKPTKDQETFQLDVTAGAQPDWYRVEVRGMSTPQPWAPVSVDEVKAMASPLFISPGPVEAKPAIAVPADQGVEDGAVLAAGKVGEFAGFPDIAVEGDVVHFVAEAHGDATSSVIYRRRNAHGAWLGEDHQLSGDGQARFPRVAVRGKDVWVVWEEEEAFVPHRPTIRLRHSSNGGASWDAIQTVRALEGRAEHPAIAITPNGHPVLVWQEIRSGEPFDIMEQEIGAELQPRNLSRAGKLIDPGTPDDTRSPRYPTSVRPSVAVGSDGRVAVAWQDNRTDMDPGWTGAAAYGAGTNPDNWQIQVTVRNLGGVWGAPKELGTADRADWHPDVAFSSKGDLVVAWDSKELAASGRNLSVRAAVSSDNGATFSAPAVLAPDTQTMSERPRLGTDPNGSVRAVWYDSRSADWRWRVMSAVYNRDSGWSAGSLLNGRGVNTWPVTAGGYIAFASTRNAARLQRDPTQQVFLLPRQ